MTESETLIIQAIDLIQNAIGSLYESRALTNDPNLRDAAKTAVITASNAIQSLDEYLTDTNLFE